MAGAAALVIFGVLTRPRRSTQHLLRSASHTSWSCGNGQGWARRFSRWNEALGSKMDDFREFGGFSERDGDQSLSGFTKASDEDIEKDGDSIGGLEVDSTTGFTQNALEGSKWVENAGVDAWSNVDFPASAVIGMLDAIHAATGTPWWLTIAGSTLALRASLFPLTIIQLNKVAKLSNLWPKLPSPIPKYGSGKTILEQWKFFRQRCLEVNAPNPLWLFVVPLVHIPIFISWIFAVRHMAITHYPDFDKGGALWFVDLTASSHGTVGAILPLLVAITYFTNIEISFKNTAMKPGHVMTLIKWYKWGLQFLTVPALYVGFSLPQGIFMYWLPNNLYTLAQTLVLQNRKARKKLGIVFEPVKEPVLAQPYLKENNNVELLKYDELIVLAAEHVAKRQHDRAIDLLGYALKKYPENVEAYIALGKLHLDEQKFVKAANFYNLAAAKATDSKILIVARSGAGVALFNQGKKEEAIAQLRMVESLQEPSDDLSKHQYYRALVILGSALYQEDQKFEALHVLRKAAEYDPNVQKFYISKLEEELGLNNSVSTKDDKGG